MGLVWVRNKSFSSITHSFICKNHPCIFGTCSGLYNVTSVFCRDVKNWAGCIGSETVSYQRCPIPLKRIQFLFEFWFRITLVIFRVKLCTCNIRVGIFTRAGILCPLVIVKSCILNMSADSYVNYLLAVRWIYAFHLSLNFSHEHSDELFWRHSGAKHPILLC